MHILHLLLVFYIPLWLISAILCASNGHGTHIPTIDQADALRRAYQELGNRVHRTLLVQLGDIAQVESQLNSARHFLSSVEHVCTC